MNVLVIIPTYNERDNLPVLARQILDQFPYRVLVVDDQSPDGTGAIADQLAAEYPGRLDVLHRTGERGLGLSYVDGFRWALATDANLNLSDGRRSLTRPALPAGPGEGLRDVRPGARVALPQRDQLVNWPLRRIVLSTFANWYVRTITGLTIHDVTGGYRCWRRDALRRLQPDRIRSRRYAFMVETVFEAARLGLRIGESPSSHRAARRGLEDVGTVLTESMVSVAPGAAQPRPRPLAPGSGQP